MKKIIKFYYDILLHIKETKLEMVEAAEMKNDENLGYIKSMSTPVKDLTYNGKNLYAECLELKTKLRQRKESLQKQIISLNNKMELA